LSANYLVSVTSTRCYTINQRVIQDIPIDRKRGHPTFLSFRERHIPTQQLGRHNGYEARVDGRNAVPSYMISAKLFSYHRYKLWNAMPGNVVSTSSIDSFWHRLKTFLFQHFQRSLCWQHSSGLWNIYI